MPSLCLSSTRVFGRTASTGLRTRRPCQPLSGQRQVLVVRAVRYQEEKTSAEKRELRSRGQDMERKRKLPKLTIGKKGICDNLHVTLADTLAKREFAKVKILPACMDGPEDLSPIIEEVNDCVCIHEIGGTMTFYRDAGLPRPDGIPVSEQTLLAQEKKAVKALQKTVEERMEEKVRFKEEHRARQKAAVPKESAFTVTRNVYDSENE